ncbi:NupC/NupG family nucleoside CNT transporter [Dongshaea marina]|uniref:NupC/NupG family nucleoside CNT transporter n=1 Tax=Dongshaea marina TaxID=2047966 RepID=UPI000D3E0AA0|nr:NupC/NupG family nucleoside CNT transporter [Dongshaea marina]
MSLIMGIVGALFLIGVAILFSDNRRAIRFRTVFGAFVIQACIGAFVLYIPIGKDILKAISDAVSQVVNYAQDGINFLFGGLVSGKMFEVFGGGGFVFALRVLPVIVFFSSLIAVLYYLGIMQWVIKLLGGALQKILGTSRTESLSATANIFVGQTEAPLVVRPYINRMTQSELFAVMCGGLASIAGSVLAGYAAMGVKMEYLVAASFMAAPGGLLFAKLLKPETETPDYDESAAEPEVDDKPANVIDAAAAGASSGMHLALNVGAMLLAFIGLIALCNGIIGGVAGWFDYGSGAIDAAYQHLETLAAAATLSPELHGLMQVLAKSVGDMARPEIAATAKQIAASASSDDIKNAAMSLAKATDIKLGLETILGWIFAPVAFLIGVPWGEATTAGSFIGQKVILNEFVAYANFVPYLHGSEIVATTQQVMSEHTKAIISFALCGFANLASVAILLGGLGGMAPSRRGEIAKFGLKAVLAGTLSNLMSASIAGFFLALG